MGLYTMAEEISVKRNNVKKKGEKRLLTQNLTCVCLLIYTYSPKARYYQADFAVSIFHRSRGIAGRSARPERILRPEVSGLTSGCSRKRTVVLAVNMGWEAK